MGFAKHDDMVGALAADGSDQPPPHGGALDLISIADQVTWSFIPGKCLRDLMCDPLGGWMRCYVDPDKISARQPDDEESVE